MEKGENQVPGLRPRHFSPIMPGCTPLPALITLIGNGTSCCALYNEHYPDNTIVLYLLGPYRI